MTEKVELIQGDCLEKMRSMKENSVDAIVTDPPYELGFMGKIWDGTGIAYNVDMWREALRVLKPGGHLLSFSGTRTYHRMACAIEDAGFEVRNQIIWTFGSGFPKGANIQKQLQKMGSDRADEFKGFGTQLKPAFEPICMARKPLGEKTVALNCLKWGTGVINIDDSRVGTEKITIRGGGNITKDGEKTFFPSNEINEERTGRFPANLIHDNSEEVRECFPDTNASKKSQRGKGSDGSTGIYGVYGGASTERGHDDNGGNASRFFKSIIYQAKASKSERGNSNNHPTVKPIALMEYLIEMVTPKGGIVLDPFMGSGSTGVACMQTGRAFIGIEMDAEYCQIAEKRILKS